MDRTLALFLDYPDDELLASRAEIAAGAPPALEGFAAWWASADPRQVCERYVADFDLQGRTSLHLTYHRFGDRRDRGRALIALKRLLRVAGWELEHWELPDYLPLLVELAAVDPEVGLPLLAEYHVELHAIRRALEETGSPWADVMRAVTDETPPAPRGAVARMLREGPPTELVGAGAA